MAETRAAKVCENCEFCSKEFMHLATKYVCRRNAPSVTKYNSQTSKYAFWPQVDRFKDWCGEFEMKEEVDEK